jgi:predicted phosphoribosyltransferase
MIFSDRLEAGRQLARRLEVWRGERPIVFAIPRGAVPMGKVIADALDGELDVVLTRKLGAPGNPEFAIGAVDETGWSYIAEYAAMAGATQEYIDRVVAAEMETMRRRRAEYTPVRPPLDPAGRVAIVVDDGLATGATMLAALHALRARHPRRLICAVPVASPEAAAKVRAQADELVCLDTPEFFHAVGQFYRDFRQVEDREVIALLRAAGSAPAKG